MAVNDQKPKAQIIKEYSDDSGRALLLYDNGMIKDANTGYIVKPPPGVLITGENSIALHRARRELRQNIVRAVASENIKAEKYRIQYGDAAYIAAITEQAMIKATNPGDPKQIDAGRFLLKEAGDSVDVDKTDDGNDDSMARGILADIAKIADAAILLHAQKKQDLGQ